MLRLLKFLSRKKKNSSFTKINSKLNPHVPWLLNVLDVSKLFFPWILKLLLNKDIHKVKLLFPFRENSLNLLILLSYSFVSIKPWVQRENRQKYLIYIYIYLAPRSHTVASLFSFHAACYSVIVVVFRHRYAKSRKSLPTKRSCGSIFVFESRSPSTESPTPEEPLV